jgi:hypothetical protein
MVDHQMWWDVALFLLAGYYHFYVFMLVTSTLFKVQDEASRIGRGHVICESAGSRVPLACFNLCIITREGYSNRRHPAV